MRRSTLLFSAAAITLLIGGWPALSRVYHSYVQRSEQAEQQQQLSQETAQLKAELQADKPALLADLQKLQADGLTDRKFNRMRPSMARVLGLETRSAKEG